VAVLRAHRVLQAEEQLAAGSAWVGEDLVFCNELGGPSSPISSPVRSAGPSPVRTCR
jgi:hypothetical protein